MKPQTATIYKYRVNLRTPLQLRGRSLTHRSGMLVRLQDAEGNSGWGEAAPLPGFSSESPATCLESMIAMLPTLPQSAKQWKNGWEVRLSSVASASFALEAAWYSLRARQKNTSLAEVLGAPADKPVHWNVLIDNLTIPGRLPKTCNTIKLKVGRSAMSEEIAWVKEMRANFGDKLSIRLDANRAWSEDEAIEFGKAVVDCNIEYIEEPTQRWQSLLDFESSTGMPYALDESLSFIWRKLEGREKHLDPGDELTVLADRVYQQAHSCVWKPTLLHGPGLGAALRSADHNIPLHNIVISSAFESGVGISTLAHYAAAFTKDNSAAGLDTYSRLKEDLLEPKLNLRSGACTLDDFNITPERLNMDRLEEVWRHDYSKK